MSKGSVIIIGAGIGGLATGLRLAHAGCDVTILETHDGPGGKMRTLPSPQGPVDAGPTVLTMRDVFDDLFASVDASLADHVTLTPLPILARHFWDDGTKLDLMTDPRANVDAITNTFGAKSAEEYEAFAIRAKRLFTAFDAPMMRHPAPSPMALTREVMRNPRLILDMAPHRSLAGLLKASFSEPKLAQLFGRYATYVGGSPSTSPAILSLIWQAEAAGVWSVAGGMHQLAKAIATLAISKGARIQYNTPVRRIVQQSGKVAGVETDDSLIPVDRVVFNGDPRAISTGLLGPINLPPEATEPRSLSAHVLAFSAAPQGLDIAHHNVFFSQEVNAEFPPLQAGKMATDATLYLCAQDHPAPLGTQQRFEIIRNAPPAYRETPQETAQCQTQICDRLATFGLTFDARPTAAAMTTPMDFDRLFPASQGSLYGRSPAGMMAAFKRPTARTTVPGLYLCGGGAHPGAGVPMATLSGAHAAAAIMQDLSLTSTSRQTATHGGMSTA